MVKVYFSVGSNLGDRVENLAQVIKIFSRDDRVMLARNSSVYETSPIGLESQPDFLNVVFEGHTELEPRDLLCYIKSVEKEIGREKTVRWGPRVIDIDILTYGDQIVEQEDLMIPHVRMKYRAFVLIPLAEICPDFVFPDGSRIETYLNYLSEEDKVFLREDIFLTDHL